MYLVPHNTPNSGKNKKVANFYVQIPLDTAEMDTPLHHSKGRQLFQTSFGEQWSSCNMLLFPCGASFPVSLCDYCSYTYMQSCSGKEHIILIRLDKWGPSVPHEQLVGRFLEWSAIFPSLSIFCAMDLGLHSSHKKSSTVLVIILEYHLSASRIVCYKIYTNWKG